MCFGEFEVSRQLSVNFISGVPVEKAEKPQVAAISKTAKLVFRIPSREHIENIVDSLILHRSS